MSHSLMHLTMDVPRFRPMEVIATPRGVLCYGHDTVLLFSRQRILEQSGCPSATVTNATEFKAQLWEVSPSVIVLCQTLSSEECSRACEFALEHCPDVRLLLLFARTQECIPPQRHDILSSNGGPRLFAQTVFHLLYEADTIVVQ